MPFDLQSILKVSAAFRFIVQIDRIPIGAFTECTLPTLEWDVEEVKEGGLNTYIHQLPGRRKSAKITLKNGVGLTPYFLMWYSQNLHEKFDRRTVTITLLSSVLQPILVLELEDAFPIKWTGPQLKSDENTVAIQTLELSCGEITVI